MADANTNSHRWKPAADQASPVPLCPAPCALCPDDGYLLIAVVAMVALVLVALAVAAPVIAKQIRRDREVESEHRAQQYVRAIRLFYRKNGAYPPSLDALKSTNNIRYLRKEYVDPLTGQGNWRILHLGQQKTTVKVFFGQELQGIGGGGLGGSTLAGSPTTSTVGQTGALAAGFQGASTTTTPGSAGATGSTGIGLTSSLTGSNGQAVGGGPIIGVGISRTGPSILTPNQQTTYDTWEFWYDPRIEILRQSVNLTGGGISSQSASSFGNNLNGTPNSANGASGATGATGSSFGSSTFGSPGTGPTTPASPSPNPFP